jgi:signal transduction histidine kinase
LSESEVLSMTVDQHKSLWLGYNNGYVDKIQNGIKTSYFIKSKNDPTYARITSFLEQDDTIWCGSDLGLFYFANNKFSRVAYDGSKDPSVRFHYYDNGKFSKVSFDSSKDPTIKFPVKQIVNDDKKNIFVTYSLNLLKVIRDPSGYYTVPVGNIINRTFSAIHVGSGRFLVSGISGLLEYIPGKPLIPFETEYDYSYQRIIDMKPDIDNRIIMATSSNGIFIQKDRKLIQHITKEDGLSDNNCHKIYIKDSLMYVSTSNGLNIFQRKDKTWKFVNVITTRDGLLSNSINAAVIVDSILYVATDKGLSIFNKNSIATNRYQPDVVITEIIADSMYTVIKDLFSFHSDVSRLLIRFSYPVYNFVNKVKLKYRLIKNNPNEQWIISDNKEVEFSSLSPGHYRFEIMPDLKNADKRITTLNIEILPMWWQTFIFKFFLVLISLLILVYAVRRRLKSNYEMKLAEMKRKNMIEEERNRIANDMHDDIGADLTQISIWSNILKSNEYAGNVHIEKISNLSKEVLLKMDQIIWALDSIHNQTSDLISYMNAYASDCLESSDVKLEFNIAEDLPNIPLSMYQRRNIFLVVKELLHNTLKHSYAKNVHIKIYMKEDLMAIEYSDDGHGFRIQNDGSGLGLTTMRKRMKEINSKIEITSELNKGMQAIMQISLK